MKSRRNWITSGVILAWIILTFSGLALFWKYENGAGLAAAAPEIWPQKSQIPRSSGLPTLIVVVHPHCPCTRASLHELAGLMSRYSGQVAAYVVFVRPLGVEPGWEETENWQNAAKITGVTLIRDDLGFEAKLLDAHVSGQTVLYGENGDLLFSGGITTGRGEEGISVGESAIGEILDGRTPSVAMTNVYGCPLIGDEVYCIPKKGTN